MCQCKEGNQSLGQPGLFIPLREVRKRINESKKPQNTINNHALISAEAGLCVVGSALNPNNNISVLTVKADGVDFLSSHKLRQCFWLILQGI